MAIRPPETGNIFCDVCGADCGYTNDDGTNGYDKQGVFRDLCGVCVDKHKVWGCTNCDRLFPTSMIDPDSLECPECNALTTTQAKYEYAHEIAQRRNNG